MTNRRTRSGQTKLSRKKFSAILQMEDFVQAQRPEPIVAEGKRPRFTLENNFRPLMANRIMQPFAGYAAIVTYLERSHHFLDQGATAVANNQHPRTGMGVSIAHP